MPTVPGIREAAGGTTHAGGGMKENAMGEWLIHLTHPSGTTTLRFTGTRAEAEAKAASYIGKPADLARRDLWSHSMIYGICTPHNGLRRVRPAS